ncbi:D-alanyl-D-alanine dipeptidase [Sporotomaculum syntrophicum]|uniref:D-alanyl-D-alanine dipeptidase n=1 Tax=Sporotomaculum syntrophicum TaxID=182264 RepID=A0A9D2WPH9_9FIRM|nr:M15 family metallopeptidase [Sporotomaculum syntrophicum]KAF1084979.1 D-alanyl-D-alanine dipeptidase [Sporotomaculum syntrophicum]
MFMISDNKHKICFNKGQVLILVLITIVSMSLAGCRANNSEEISPKESQYEESEVPITQNSPPLIEPVEQANTEPRDEDLVRILDYIPSVYIELKYATTDNFTGKIIYDFTDASLRYGTIKKLKAVQEELAEQGYSLKIWDAYRPVSAQFTLWDVCPNPVYVANPNTGYSSHSKGNTIDVTLVLSDGTEIMMPSCFDDFSEKADRDYSDVSDEAAANAALLENTMSAHGFNCYSGEWWHFSDSTAYTVL